jgi:hypothetical protein
MFVAALVLICAIPQMDDTAKTVSEIPAVSTADSNASKDATLVASSSLPSAPTPKVNADPEAITPNAPAQPVQPIRPAILRPRETPTQRKMWYALTFVSSAGAAFDAWSTKRAVVGGYGTESNPFLKPFAHSNAIYAATQVSPAVMDFIGKRMMTSEHPLIRKLWWMPQVLGSGMSFASGAHNTALVH